MSSLSSQDRALYEDGTLSLDGVRAAWGRRDPRLSEYLIKLVTLDPAPAEMGEAAKAQKATYLNAVSELTEFKVARKVAAKDPSIPGTKGYSRVQRTRAIGEVYHETFSELETEATLPYLPDRLKLHALIEEIWDDTSAYARETLLELIRKTPMKWGPWRGLKRIFKRSIERQDWAVFAALTVRFEKELQRYNVSTTVRDRSPLIPNEDGELEQIRSVSNRSGQPFDFSTTRFSWDDRRSRARDVSTRTFEYLLRRAWRALQHVASSNPAAYPFVAAELLSAYPPKVRVQAMAEVFKANAELWASDIAPLMQLVEKAANTKVLDFAFSTLEKRFRDELKNADPQWILRLAQSERRTARRLAVRWFLEPLCGYEQSQYHTLGLQPALLAFLDYNDEKQTQWNAPERYSAWSERSWLKTWKPDAGNADWPVLARKYALDYIKSNYAVIADDLPLSKVMWLLRHGESEYRDVGAFLLYPGEGPSPYDDQLDVAFWTELLEDSQTFDMAQRAIRQKFSGAELSSQWYAERLLSKHGPVREMAQAFLRDETKYRADDDWLGFHKTIVRSHEAVADILQLSLYQLSRRDDAGASLLDGLPATFFRMLLVHPKDACHQAVIGWCEGGRFDADTFGVDFLKKLSTPADWDSHGWLTDLGDEALPAHEDIAYNGTVGVAVRRWLKTMASLESLGADWVLARVEIFEQTHDFIRNVFRRDMPFSALAEDPTADDAAVQGAHAVVEKILEETDAKSRRANFYRNFLYARHPLMRQDENPNLPALGPALALPPTALPFSWFERMATDPRAPIREMAMKLGGWEMARWTDEAPLTFARLKPLLRDAFSDIREYLVQSITAPRRPEGRLDVERSQFKIDELYAYCFDTSQILRELGMNIIVRLPQRFGQPSQLLKLSESTDRRVRELVIEVVWRQFRNLTVTDDWQPNPRSVVPQSLSLSRSQRVVTLPLPPPTDVDPANVRSNRKYLGQGVPKQSETALDARDAFEGFVRSVLFQLPPVRQSPKLPPRPQPVTTAWRNKRTLIIAVRDLATKDADFASFVLPILQEFQHVRGKMVREACLTALAYIQMSHPELQALTDNA